LPVNGLLAGGLPVVRVLPAEEQKAREILARHIDKSWTLCDAISFAVLDARRVGRAFTFDHHFRQYGRIQVIGLKARTDLKSLEPHERQRWVRR
jgi:uncharacterized protein